MPNGEPIEAESTFVSIRSKYKATRTGRRSRPTWGGEPPVFRYHRFWAQADIAIANASYGWLFPDDKAAPAALASEPGKADDGAARKGSGRAHSSRAKKQK